MQTAAGVSLVVGGLFGVGNGLIRCCHPSEEQAANQKISPQKQIALGLAAIAAGVACLIPSWPASDFTALELKPNGELFSKLTPTVPDGSGLTDPLLWETKAIPCHPLEQYELLLSRLKNSEPMQTYEVAEACSDLKRVYLSEGDHTAGYYMLALIKHATGCTYEIPEKDVFDSSTVSKILSQPLEYLTHSTNLTNFIDILNYGNTRLDKPLYQEVLDKRSSYIFLNLVAEQLKNAPINTWPHKGHTLTNLLEAMTSESRLCIAEILASSEDMTTSKIGSHLSSALTATSLREAIPHFYALEELLPHLNECHFEIIFGRPFVEFRQNKWIYNSDPGFTRRLRFNDMRQVFVHDSLMIGAYDTRTIWGEKGVLPHLLAYDMNTEKMVWGIPLTPIAESDLSLDISARPAVFGMPRMIPREYSLKKMGELLSLQFIGENKVQLIHPETGKLNSTLELPEASQNTYARFHIGPEGLSYQMVRKGQERVLLGGKIADGQWNSSFETKTPTGLFLPFSTHCGFHDNFENSLVLFGPTGDQVTIEGCMNAVAQDDKLYSIETDPAYQDKYLLNIRTLKTANEVVSSIERSISLDAKEVSFGGFSRNGGLVLFSENHSDTSPIFVDLNSQKITYSGHRFSRYNKHIVDSHSGEVWNWDELSTKVWKTSTDGTTFMGSLKSGRGTSLLHIDDKKQLYFVDIS